MKIVTAQKTKKERKKRAKLFTLDTETRGLQGEVFRCGLFDGSHYYACDTFDEILTILQTKYKDIDEKHIYVHNLDFDLKKISPVLLAKEKIDFSRSIFINGNVVTFATESIILHDSYRLLPSSLDKLCEDFGLKDNAKKDLTDVMKEQGYAIYNEDGTININKSKDNYFSTVPAHDPILNEYMEYDHRSLYEIIQQVLQIAKINIDTLIMCPTTASLAMKVYQTNYEEDYEKAIQTKYYNKFAQQVLEPMARNAYFGGRVEVFRPRLDNGYHYDVNSLYPFVMKVAPYPVGFPKHLNGEAARQKYEFWKRRGRGGGLLHCNVYIPEDIFIPPLPHRDKSGKLIFPVGRIDGVWTFPELREAELLGCVIEEVIQCVYFEKMEYIFTGYVTQLEEIKQNSEGAKRTFAKLLLNSLYGKFGMKRDRASIASMDDIEDIREKADEQDTTYHIHHYDNGGVKFDFVEHVTFSKAAYIQPHIAAYVTSYARIWLLRGLLQQEKTGQVNYCDTDSIAGTGQMAADMIDDSVFGKWKLEGVVMEGIFLQPKLYSERYDNGKLVLKAKGIPREVMAGFTFETYEEWYNIIKNQSADKIDIFRGHQTSKKFLSILKENEHFEAQRIVRKSMNLTLEQKRKIDFENNTSTPLKRYTYGEQVDEEEKESYEAYQQQLLLEYDDVDTIKETVEQYGYIQIPVKGDKYYREYKQFSRSVQAKYFRKSGLALDVWCEEAGWDADEFVEEIRLQL